MMLSVRNHTTGPVKFWILSNFLSPSFKVCLIQLRNAFLVTLRKSFLLLQRISDSVLSLSPTSGLLGWEDRLRNSELFGGMLEISFLFRCDLTSRYKILFLDVLFPINLTKIIYIDADQTVRADMTELRDMNLHVWSLAFFWFAHFLGCTLWLHAILQWRHQEPIDDRIPILGQWLLGGPFERKALPHLSSVWIECDWAHYLSVGDEFCLSKFFFLSCLLVLTMSYVVDLNNLRRSGHADQLRSSYDGLTRDPGSLANLDQGIEATICISILIRRSPELFTRIYSNSQLAF